MNTYREPETMEELRAALADRNRRLKELDQGNRRVRQLASLVFTTLRVGRWCLKWAFHTWWLAAVLWHPFMVMSSLKTDAQNNMAAWVGAVLSAMLLHWCHYGIKQDKLFEARQ